MNRNEAHSALIKDILTKCGALTCCRIWRNDTGMAVSLDHARKIRYGLKGSADISGIGLGGIRIEIECKTGSARQSKQQLAFQEMIENFDGLYILARDAEDVKRELLNYFS